ncbi:hypothetical protein MRX96_042085 [Rhipicephalus microplus]
MPSVGERTVVRVREEVKASPFSGGKLTTPSRKRPRNAQRDLAVKEITSMSSERRQLPSLRRCTLRHLLVDIGFKHGKGRSRNSLLIDRDDIPDWRNRYLHGVERYRAEGQKIFYLDETWARAGHTRDKIKQVTAEDWRKSIQRRMDVEAKLRLDTSASERIQPIIIQLEEDDTDESDDGGELCGIEPLDDA